MAALFRGGGQGGKVKESERSYRGLSALRSFYKAIFIRATDHAARMCKTTTLMSSRRALYFTAVARMVSA